jgi:GAF domain-containing protein
MLMTIVFPPASWDRDYAAAFIPFHFKPVHATPLFEQVLMPHKGTLGDRANVDPEKWAWGRLLKAYLHILRTFYGVELTFDYPLIITAKDRETGLDRYFKISMDPQFIEVKKVGKLKPLSEQSKKRLMANVTDPELWMELIPPGNFEFHGFTVVRAVDVTDQEVLSSLRRDLIEKESIFSKDGYDRLQKRLRTFLRNPELILGLAAIQGEQVFILSPEYKLDHDCILADSFHCTTCDFEGSIFAQAIEKGEPLVIEDLKAYPNHGFLEKEFIKKGVRSIFVTPLHYQDKLLGTLDLKSPNPGDLKTISVMKLWEILPLFSMALNRSLEELNHRVQGVIKEKCTAIHPSVEWRFRKAALNFIDKQRDGGSVELEPIVFRDVYPLYGLSDIRGSSDHRNLAIQADMVDHLTMAREIIVLARSHRSLPILDALAYRIGKEIADLESGLRSGDEVAKLDFIRRVVEPHFDHIQEFSPDVRRKIDAYRAAMDPHVGTLYRKRKDFEETVGLINETVSSYLVNEEEKAQEFFPHYFEKQKTDGVDHSIYIGASMVEDGRFDLLYLKNLRLWQLMVMCRVAWQTERLKKKLKVPLEATHLILVQNTPLSIRFRPDEKRFDVDGAYDIRHEIIKKRIDKAVIKGGTERSHQREALEYREYIDYLQASGYLTDELEEFDLEDLQGVHGLKALRVGVDVEAAALKQKILPEQVKEAVEAMPRVSTGPT